MIWIRYWSNCWMCKRILNLGIGACSQQRTCWREFFYSCIQSSHCNRSVSSFIQFMIVPIKAPDRWLVNELAIEKALAHYSIPHPPENRKSLRTFSVWLPNFLTILLISNFRWKAENWVWFLIWWREERIWLRSIRDTLSSKSRTVLRLVFILQNL